MGPPCPCTSLSAYRHHAGRLLDAACVRHGLSNVEIAKRLKVGRDSVSKQRKGEKWLEVEPLIQLARLAHVPPSSVLPDDPTSLLSQLMQETAGLSPEMQAIALAWVRAFVRELRQRSRPAT